MIEKLPELVNNNEALIRRGRWLNDVFLVRWEKFSTWSTWRLVGLSA